MCDHRWKRHTRKRSSRHATHAAPNSSRVVPGRNRRRATVRNLIQRILDAPRNEKRRSNRLKHFSDGTVVQAHVSAADAKSRRRPRSYVKSRSRVAVRGSLPSRRERTPTTLLLERRDASKVRANIDALLCSASKRAEGPRVRRRPGTRPRAFRPNVEASRGRKKLAAAVHDLAAPNEHEVVLGIADLRHDPEPKGRFARR